MPPHHAMVFGPLPPREVVNGSILIERLVGKGGNGWVYLASRPPDRRPLALKCLDPPLLAFAEPLERFNREVAAPLHLPKSPYILTAQDSGTHGRIPWYIMEFAVGGSLASNLEKWQSPPMRRRLEFRLGLIRHACLGLAAAHEQGVIHRDVKPANILISTGRGCVNDWGAAHFPNLPGITTYPPGTLEFMAPEQFRSGSLDIRLDIYGLGLTILQSVTGIMPPEQKNEGWVHRTLRDQKVPGVIATIIERATKDDPSLRFAGAQEMADLLARIV